MKDHEEVIKIIKEKLPLFNVEELGEELKLSREEVSRLILELKRAKLIAPVYRLNTEERFLIFDNDWTYHLQDLCKIFTSTKGNSFDGSEIHNIEFKFKLLASS